MQRMQTRFLILIIILLLAIGYILLRADRQIDAVDQQMPEIGCIAMPTLL